MTKLEERIGHRNSSCLKTHTAIVRLAGISGINHFTQSRLPVPTPGAGEGLNFSQISSIKNRWRIFSKKTECVVPGNCRDVSRTGHQEMTWEGLLLPRADPDSEQSSPGPSAHPRLNPVPACRASGPGLTLILRTRSPDEVKHTVTQISWQDLTFKAMAHFWFYTLVNSAKKQTNNVLKLFCEWYNYTSYFMLRYCCDITILLEHVILFFFFSHTGNLKKWKWLLWVSWCWGVLR